MDPGRRSDEDVSDLGQYDFDRLERSVEFLLKEHERLSGEHEAMLAELVERELRISTLERLLDSEQGKCKVALEGVDKILARLEQLQTNTTASIEAAS